jgi:hypothetical protein
LLRKEREGVVVVRGEAGSCRPLFIGVGRRLEGQAEHAVLVRLAAMSVRPCRRQDVGDVFKAVATWWCCG